MSASPAEALPTPARMNRGPLLLALGLLLLYTIPNYSFYMDGLMFAGYAQNGDWIERVHPHHLGYSTFFWLIRVSCERLGIALDLFALMTTTSVLASLGCLWRFWRIVRRVGFELPWATVGVAALALCYSFWNLGTSAGVYLPTLFFLLSLFEILLAWVWSPPTRVQLAWASVYFTIACLIHQLAVFAGVTAVLWAWSGRAQTGPLRRWKFGALFALVLALPIGLCYIAAYAVANPFLEDGSFLNWLTRFGSAGHWWLWQAAKPGQSLLEFAVTQSAISFARLLVPIFGFDSVAPWRSPQNLADLQGYFAGLAVLGAILLGVRTVRWARAKSPLEPELRGVITLCLLAIGPLFLFQCFYEPINPAYRLYYLPQIVLLLLLPYGKVIAVPASLEQHRRKLACTVLGIVVAFNVGFAWIPHSDPSYNPWLQALPEVDAQPPGILIYPNFLVAEYVDYIHARLFFKRPVIIGKFVETSPLEPLKLQTPFILGDPQTMVPEHAVFKPRWLAVVSDEPGAGVPHHFVLDLTQYRADPEVRTINGVTYARYTPR